MDEERTTINELQNSLAGARLAENGDQLQVGTQEKELSVLTDTVKTLSGRLNHVLTPNMTESSDKQGVPDRPPLSPLAERINSNNNIISRINAQLSDIIRRLEC